MLNVPELEKKWIKYKVKSFLPHIILSVLLLIIIPLVIVFYPSKNTHNEPKNSQKQQEVKQTVQKESDQNISPVVKNDKSIDMPDKAQDSDKLVLKPSLNFVTKMEDSMVTYYDDGKNSQEPVKKLKANPRIVTEKAKITVQPKPKPIATNVQQTTENDNKNEINIKMHSVDKDLQDVIQRFKKTNNPVLSLFLAKKYYEMKKYNLSYNYALITNQIDNKIDMSWIIFAKSLVKLGQKDMAVNTLKSYIKNSNSQTATTLLDEIETGRFQ